jgi:oligopeptide transport system permease protein
MASAPTTTAEFGIGQELVRGSSLWSDAWFRLKKNHLALFGLGFFLFMTCICLLGPFFTGYRYEDTDLPLKASPPLDKIISRVEQLKNGGIKKESLALSNIEDEFLDLPTAERKAIVAKLANGEQYTNGSAATVIPGGMAEKITYEPSPERHLFGTDPLGRDLLTRVLVGGRISLAVGFAATLVSVVIGVIWGATAGFVGGKLDNLMMRTVDILYALPFTVIVILLMVLFGRNFILLFVAIGAVEWLTMARIVRGQIISLKHQEFVEAAVSLGLSGPRILFRHLIPNVASSIIVYATLTVPNVMLLEAVLSFLGLGVPPPMSSWGVLIDEGSRAIETSPWLLWIPAAFFSLTLFSLNFLGDGLRDALDPKSAKD